MKQNHKVLLVCVCALLLVIGSVLGTLAYFTDKDEAVNTFTVGKVEISMDEAVVDEYGVVKENADPARTNANAYKLIPGHEYVKDPTIYVTADSEACWLFAEVNNGIAAFETKTEADTIVGQMEAKGWKLLYGNIYYQKAEDTDADQKFVVFEKFTVAEEANEVAGWDNIKPETTNITVTAYAVQADGFDGAEAAWKATFGKSAP